MSKKFAVILLGLLIFLFIAAGSTVRAEDTIQLKAGFLNYLDERIELREGVTIIRGEVTITALRGEYFRESREAELEQEVEMIFADGNITSSRLNALLESNRYIFRENVEFTREQEDRLIIIRSPFLELNEEAKTFAARDGVEIDYDQRKLRSREADFDEETEQMVLTEDVFIEEEDGDWIRGNRAVFFTGAEEDRFEVEGDVELEIDISS